MSSNKELQVAYGLIAVLLITGILCYSAFSSESPEEPIRIMFKSTAGKVLFDHKYHQSDDGYSVECLSCHHNIEEDDTYSCGECHEQESDDEAMPSRSDAFHNQCIECHEDLGGPKDCAECHIM